MPTQSGPGADEQHVQTGSKPDSAIRINILAIAIGIIAGLGAVLFRGAIWLFQNAFFGNALNPGDVQFEELNIPNLYALFGFLGSWRLVLVPAVGGLLVGLVIQLTTREVSGHGVPKVLIAVLTRGGRIDPKIALYKTIASSIAIGSGGSLGREGPIVQIGSAAGSFFGKFVRHKAHTRTLVAAGAAGGIAATFNAPLAGIMFALEIILAQNNARNVVAVVLSSVVATAVARPILQFTPTPGVREFLVPVQFELVNPAIELPLYLLLGLFVAVAGMAMVRMLYAVEHVTEQIRMPFLLKPASGGALLGLSGLVSALVLGVPAQQSANWLFGVGYSTIGSSLRGELVLGTMAVLGLMKLVGFSLSIGTGSSGGIFSPCVYVGAMIGGAFGLVVHAWIPNTAGAGAYALVGMGGVFAAAARAPLTSALIIFELTGEYTIILPVLLVCVLGSEVAERLMRGSTIYNQKLRDMGLTVQERRIGSLEDSTAADVMTRDLDVLHVGDTVGEASLLFARTRHHTVPIVDAKGHLVGLVRHHDIARPLTEGTTLDRDQLVEDVGIGEPDSVSPDSNLLSVVDCMKARQVGRLPVIDDNGVLVGMVSRGNILAAYDLPLES